MTLAPVDELVRRFLPLARKLAARYTSRREPFEDLMQVACIGLLGAIDRFDPERGAKFDVVRRSRRSSASSKSISATPRGQRMFHAALKN